MAFKIVRVTLCQIPSLWSLRLNQDQSVKQSKLRPKSVSVYHECYCYFVLLLEEFSAFKLNFYSVSFPSLNLVIFLLPENLQIAKFPKISTQERAAYFSHICLWIQKFLRVAHPYNQYKVRVNCYHSDSASADCLPILGKCVLKTSLCHTDSHTPGSLIFPFLIVHWLEVQ